jgi:hypothetical protein
MGMLNIFDFNGKYFAGIFDGITDMGTALLYNFRLVLPSLRGG